MAQAAAPSLGTAPTGGRGRGAGPLGDVGAAGAPAPPLLAGQQQATWDDVVRAVARQHGVNPALAIAVMQKESSRNPNARGALGELGLFQLMPGTAQQLGVDATDPLQNITGGVRYLKQLNTQYQGDLRKTLMAYNGGPRWVDEGTPSQAAQAYAQEVLGSLTAAAAGGQPGPGSGRASGAGPGGGMPATTSVPPPALPPGATRDMLGPSTVEGDPRPPQSLLATMAEGFDPRRTEGRINLAAGLAGLAAGAATRSPAIGSMTYSGVAPWLLRVLGPPVAAGLAGGATAGAEVQLGTAPAGTDPLKEGALQGAYEGLGQAFMWPIRRIGRSFLASSIAQQAKPLIQEGIASTKAAGRAAVQAAQDRMRSAVQAARTLATATRETLQGTQAGERAALRQTARGATRAAREAGAAQVDVARRQAAARLADAELQSADEILQARRQYDNLLAPDRQAAGQAAGAVIRGPSQAALDQAGRRVSDVAAMPDAPPIAVAPLKAELERLARQFRPEAVFPAEEATGVAGFLRNVAARQPGASSATIGRMTREEFQAYIAGQLGVEPTHPLPGLLGQIQNIPTETISFADAHKLKMLLDEAVNWEQISKKHLGRITKGLRIGVREALGAFEPYNIATAVYEGMVPLYRQGVGKSLVQAARTIDGADRIARTLKADNPAQAQVLKDLLTTQAAAGGEAAAGQQAWDLIRSAFVYDRVIKGGVEGLDDRLRRLVVENPSFSRIVFDDVTSQRILTNLDTIATTFRSVTEAGAARTAATKEAGQAGVRGAQQAARRATADVREAGEQTLAAARTAQRGALATERATGRQQVQAAQTAGRADVRATQRAAATDLRAQQQVLEAFRRSSVQSVRSAEMLAADILRGTVLGPVSLWGALSAIRLLKSAKAGDVIQWAAYSSENTQMLVRLLEGTLPERAAVGAVRAAAQVAYPGAGVILPPPPPFTDASPTESPDVPTR